MTGAAAPHDRIAAAEDVLGHRFHRPELLREALTHRSAAGGRGRGGRRARGAATTATPSNERLEFIGDRVLGLLVAEWLLERFPEEAEGKLGPRLAHLVSREALSAVAAEAGLGQALSLGANEVETGVARSAAVLADAAEAAIGALYLDGGLEAARQWIRRAWAPLTEAQRLPPKDAKTALQEWLLARGLGLPEYVLMGCAGPSHAPSFSVAARGGGRETVADAGNKRAAERLAAAALLETLRASGAVSR